MEPHAFLSWSADGTTVVAKVDIIPQWEDVGESQLTQDPIESGSSITHHKAELPDTLTVTVAVSQTPIYGGKVMALDVEIPPSKFRPGGLLALTTAARGAIATVAEVIDTELLGGTFGLGEKAKGLQTMQFEKFRDPGNELHDMLTDCRKKAYDCTITLGVNRHSMRSYDGYQLLKVVRTHTVDEGERSTFELSFQKLNVVETEITTIAIPDPLAAAKELAKKIVKGNQPGKVRDDAAESAKRTSLLKQGLDALQEF